MDSEKAIMSVDTTAIMLGVSRNSAYSAVQRGEIPHIKIGKRILIPNIAIERMLAEAGNKSKTSEK